MPVADQLAGTDREIPVMVNDTPACSAPSKMSDVDMPEALVAVLGQLGPAR